MMLIEIRQWPVGFAESEILIAPDLHLRHRVVTVLHDGRNAHHRWIEIRDATGGADRDIELHVGDAESDPSEPLGVGLVAAHAVTPRASGFDVIVVLAELKTRAGKFAGNRSQSRQ